MGALTFLWVGMLCVCGGGSNFNKEGNVLFNGTLNTVILIKYLVVSS